MIITTEEVTKAMKNTTFHVKNVDVLKALQRAMKDLFAICKLTDDKNATYIVSGWLNKRNVRVNISVMGKEGIIFPEIQTGEPDKFVEISICETKTHLHTKDEIETAYEIKNPNSKA